MLIKETSKGYTAGRMKMIVDGRSVVQEGIKGKERLTVKHMGNTGMYRL